MWQMVLVSLLFTILTKYCLRCWLVSFWTNSIVAIHNVTQLYPSKKQQQKIVISHVCTISQTNLNQRLFDKDDVHVFSWWLNMSMRNLWGKKRSLRSWYETGRLRIVLKCFTENCQESPKFKLDWLQLLINTLWWTFCC